MRRPLVAGNWKMNGLHASVAELVESLGAQLIPDAVEVVVFPGALHVAQVLSGLQGAPIAVGVQNCSVEPGFGALTGEISSSQASDLGCQWALVGHSERRLFMGERDEVVAEKFAAALSSGLKVVVCVGETWEQRVEGLTEKVIDEQLDAVLKSSGIASFRNAVVAYEPVWAIGTGNAATPEQAQEVHAFIRAKLACEDASVAEGVRILYGGSVKSSSASELFAMPDIDGGLVGGASLNAQEFGAICRAVGI